MKTKIISFFVLIPLMAGCSLFDDATTVTISTELTADVPVVVTAIGKKSVAVGIDFSKSQDLTLASNADIEPYLSKIKEIDLNSLLVTVTGLGEGQTINSIALDVAGVGNVFTQTNISMTNNVFTPTISSGIFDQVAAKLKSDKKITLTLSGNVSGPMSFTASLNFDASIKANVLK